MAYETPTECFFLKPTDMIRRSLRVFESVETERTDWCPSTNWYHDASILVGDFEQTALPPGRYERDKFPQTCGCGYKFTDADFRNKMVNDLHLYVRDNGELYTLRNLPPGAMYDMPWKHDFPQWCGVDGLSICVILPNGAPWEIDSKASNCTKPDDDVHKCWCRHGEPPKITVDKVGNTCEAGAGSIIVRDFHGFLRNGFLILA